MKILLTGANGFLGKNIKNHLYKLYDLKTLGRNNCDYTIDLTSSEFTIKENFDLVIHAAGMAHFIPKNENDQKLFNDVNVVGTSKLLNSFNHNNYPKFFVFISSVSVYGITNGELINENHSLQATDPYGVSKIYAENMIFNWCSNNNIICTIVRLPLIVGENPPGNLGALIKSIKQGYYFNISNNNAQKSMVLANDISKFIVNASQVGGIYNLTDGHHPKFFELAETISLHFGKTIKFNIPKFLVYFFAKIGDLVGDKFPINSKKLNKIISNLTFDDTKARTSFGWSPNKVLDFFEH